MAEQCGRHHAQGHGFAMLKTLVVSCALQRVREGVAEIQDLAEPGLAFITAHHFCFYRGVARDEVLQRSGIAAQYPCDVLFEIRKHLGVSDDTVFDDFGEAATEFPLRQCSQNPRIRQDELRRIKRANQIFPLRKINPGLAADRTVHLSDDSCGDLNKTDAAKIRRRDKTGNIANHTAADRDNQRTTIGAGSQQRARNTLDRTEIFPCFRVVHQVHFRGITTAKIPNDCFACRAPDFRRRNNVEAGEFSQLGDSGSSFLKNANPADNIV